MIFVSCGNSNSLATRQPQSFSSSYPLTNISTSIFFNCKKMTILLLKYNCALREDGTIVSTYGEFSEYLLEEIFDIVGNKPAVFLFRFIFITVNNSRVITAQLSVVRNIKRYKVLIREKSLFWSNVRRSYQILYILTLMVNLYFENYLFVKLWNRVLQIWESILCIHKPDNKAAKLIAKFVDSTKNMLIVRRLCW